MVGRLTSPRPRTGRGRRGAAAGVLWQFALVAGAALLYFLVRGLTQGEAEEARRHGFDVLGFEARLGLDVEARWQALVLRRPILVTFANWVYMWGHWPVVGVTLLVLYLRRRGAYLHLRNAMFVSGAIGLVIFASYPVAPPRLLSDGAFVDTVTRWSRSYRVLQPPALVNRYAAMPSLHVGWNLLVGVALWTSFRSRAVRCFAVVGPSLMCIAVVVTANHYVLDAIVGAALALFGLVVAVRGSRLLGHEAPHDVEIVDDEAPRAERDEVVRVADGVHAPHVEARAPFGEDAREVGGEPVAADAHRVDDPAGMAQQEPPQLPGGPDRPHHGGVGG